MKFIRSNSLLLAILALPLACLAQATYTYDSGGRLIKADYGAAGSITYGYDPAGHLISRTKSSTATSGTINSVATAFAPPHTGISQNTWVQIKGTNLVSANTPADGVDWSNAPDFAQGRMPTVLNGISVSINNKPAYVYSFCSAVMARICSQDLVNVLSPPDMTLGPVQVVVTNNGAPTPPFTVTMNALTPKR